ncbi:MAG: hypothetical protein ACRC5R_01655 [Mycoplasmatales bacterium]
MNNIIEHNPEENEKVATKLLKEGNLAQKELDNVKRTRYSIASMEAKNFFNVLVPLIDKECVEIEKVFSGSMMSLAKKIETTKYTLEETDSQIASQFDYTSLPGKVDR